MTIAVKQKLDSSKRNGCALRVIIVDKKTIELLVLYCWFVSCDKMCEVQFRLCTTGVYKAVSQAKSLHKYFKPFPVTQPGLKYTSTHLPEWRTFDQTMSSSQREGAADSAPPSKATDAVLVASDPIPDDARQVKGIDWSALSSTQTDTVTDFVHSLCEQGFQSSAVGDAIRIINEMVRGNTRDRCAWKVSILGV